jgi:hypothetical protein
LEICCTSALGVRMGRGTCRLAGPVATREKEWAALHMA